MAGGEDSAEDFCAVGDLEEAVVDGGAGAGGPESTMRVGVDAGFEWGVFAEEGVGAVGGEDEVVGAELIGAGVEEDFVVLREVALDAVGCSDGDAGGEGGGVEGGEEVVAWEAVGAGIMEFAVGEVDEDFAPVGEGAEAVDGLGVFYGGVEEAQGAEDELAGGLEEDACADGAELRGLFVEGDAVALLGEEEGGGESGDAGAGDADGERHGGIPLGGEGANLEIVYWLDCFLEQRMKNRLAKRLGVAVSEIGLGCWQLGAADWGDVSEEAGLAILRASVERGVTFIDTADVYGSGRSERLIGNFRKTLADGGKSLFIATKLGRLKGYPDGYSYELFRECTLESMERLGVSSLDLTQLHCVPPAALVAGRAGGVFEWLRKLKQEGLIRHFGASVESMEEAGQCV